MGNSSQMWNRSRSSSTPAIGSPRNSDLQFALVRQPLDIEELLVHTNRDLRRPTWFFAALFSATAMGQHSALADSKGGAVSAHAISAPKGEGTIQGMGESFSAGSSTGIFTQHVPIAVPAGRGGFQPSPALATSTR